MKFKSTVPFLARMCFHTCLLLIILVGCKSQKSTAVNINYQQLASEKLGADYSSSYNEARDMVICVNEKEKVGLEKVDYMIFDLDNSKLVYERFNFMGSITWYNNSVIRIKRITGVTSARNTNAGITYYDLIKNENINPSDIEK